MAKNKSSDHIPEHILKLITVTPERTEEFRRRTVSYTIHPKPEGKTPKGKLWCCYCGSYERFVNIRENEGSYPRCEKCSISIEDFHIRKQNHLWGNLGKK